VLIAIQIGIGLSLSAIPLSIIESGVKAIPSRPYPRLHDDGGFSRSA
jgi:hypothetical protein